MTYDNLEIHKRIIKSDRNVSKETQGYVKIPGKKEIEKERKYQCA
jgi:hypothetical protein